MKKRYIQLKTSFLDLIDLIKRFKKRLFKFFGLDKLLKLKIVIFFIKYLKIFIKVGILFKLSLILINIFDNNLYLNLMGVLTSLYFLLRDDLFNKIKDYILNKLDISTLKVKDDFVAEIQKLNKNVDQINEIESRHKKLNDKYVKDLKLKEQQMFQDYQTRLTQLKNKYNHLSIKYTEPSMWSDWWNREKWNILMYSTIIIFTIGIGYYAYINLDSITDYFKSIFYAYLIKTPYDFICDKTSQTYQYLKSFFTFPGKDIPKPDDETEDYKSIDINYGRTTPELLEAEETQAWRIDKRINHDGLLDSESGSDSDSKASKLYNSLFGKNKLHEESSSEGEDNESIISEHSTTSSDSSTIKGVSIHEDSDSDSGGEDNYLTPPPSMNSSINLNKLPSDSYRNVAPGISRNTSLMSTSIWGDRIDFTPLNTQINSLESTSQWTENSSSSSDSNTPSPSAPQGGDESSSSSDKDSTDNSSKQNMYIDI